MLVVVGCECCWGRGSTQWAEGVGERRRTAEYVWDERLLVQGEREGEGAAPCEKDELEAAAQHMRAHNGDESIDREGLAGALPAARTSGSR